jgi:hypothetical protein
MQREDRAIHFSTELFHPATARTVQKLQELYFELSKTRAAYENTDFNPGKPFRFYTTHQGKARSILLFLPDRIVVIEDWPNRTATEFCDRVEIVARHLIEVAGPDRIVAQTALVRSTFALTHHTDARVFMMERVCKLQDQLKHLGRPLANGGLRILLPQTPEHRGAMHVQIDSFNSGGNEIVVEARGVYDRLSLHVPDLAETGANIMAVRTFIGENVYAFLNGFDVPSTPFQFGG